MMMLRQRLARAPLARSFSTNGHPFVFDSRHEYMEYLDTHQSRLPWGFSVATKSFEFVPQEAPHLPATMTLSLIKPIKPTPLFGAVFTQNAFPGAPVVVGRKRLHEEKLGAILVNNKISNVCASGGGVTDAQEVCDALAKHLRLDSGNLVLPSSTGVIGWRIPVEAMIEQIPHLVENLQSESVLPVAEGIMTTDLYPKIRSVDVCGGRITGIAKGAGMIEPDMVRCDCTLIECAVLAQSTDLCRCLCVSRRRCSRTSSRTCPCHATCSVSCSPRSWATRSTP